MSLQAICWAMKHRPGTPQKKLLLIELANFMNDATGECFPSYKRLAKQMHSTDRSIKTWIKELAADGYLSIEHSKKANGGDNSNRYLLNYEGVKEIHPNL